tara:strand:+ start:345 stop:656 length:312 start_codon:yes stop_codon:yes gene_type:complete
MNHLREELEEEAKITHASIEWWRSEMSSLINKSEILEAKGEDHPEFEAKMEKIRLQMNYLIYKGEWENKQLFKLQQKINKYQANKSFEFIEKKTRGKNKKRKG